MPRQPRVTPPGQAAGSERSFGALMRELSTDISLLLRQELALARAEMREAMSRMGGAVARIAAGAGIGAVGALTLLAGVIVLLGALIGSYWLAALIVGVVLVAIGGWLGISGARRLRSVDPAPRRTLETLRGTARWARDEATELRANLLGRGEGRALGAREASHRMLPVPSGEAHLPQRRRHFPVAAERGRPASGHAAVAEADTGSGTRQQSHPGRARRETPPRSAGMLAFLKHVGAEIKEDEITGHAAKLAYYSFMALPPALMALFGLAGLVGSERLAGWLQEQAALALPTAVNEGIIQPFIQQVVLDKAPGPFSIGLLLALWGGSSVFVGLMDTLNHAYDVESARSYVRTHALAVAIMIGNVLLFVGAAGSLLLGPAIIDAVGLGPAGRLFWTIVQWPIAFLFMVAAFWVAYYFLPNRDQSGCKMLLVKVSAIAAAVWVLATAAFRVYIANFSSYSETYGFLGAFIILLLWLYVTGLVVLAGGELASEMERRA